VVDFNKPQKRRKRSAKPTDTDFRADLGEPQLMKGPQVSEEPKPSVINRSSKMPIIDFTEYDLDNLPELKILPAGTEAKLRILEVSVKPDRNSDNMLQVRLDVADEPLVKEVYWQCHFPSGSMTEKRGIMLKRFLAEFCEAFDIDKTASNDTSEWLGREGWAILGVRSDAKYGDSNEVNRFLKQQ
jgi:hypothetical protein